LDLLQILVSSFQVNYTKSLIQMCGMHQILDWLAHSPSDIESYIRPGCVILTIYLCLFESQWEEVCHFNFKSSV
jgi:hypothetical protein